jgi:hypothetical protein
MYWKLIKWGGTVVVVLLVIAGVLSTRGGDGAAPGEQATPGEQESTVAPGEPQKSTQKFNF